MLRVRLVLPQPLKEGVAQAGLAGMVEMFGVLLDNQSPVVEDRPELPLYLLQCLDAGCLTLRPGMTRLKIGDYIL